MNNKVFRIYIVVVLAFLMALGFFIMSNTTASDSLKNNSETFKFSDYKSKEELKNAFRVLFPPGTKKDHVDRILVELGNTKILETQEALNIKPKYILVSYQEPINLLRTIKKPFFHNFIYDENLKLLQIQAFGGHVVFEELPSRTKLNAMKHSQNRNLADD